MSRTADRHRRLRAVFDEALLREPSARAAYVHDACASDPDLGSEVMRLLAAHEDTRSFLDHPPQLLRSAVLAEEHFPGTRRFRVMRRLGAGGMGVVYEVHDRIRDEVVALKTFLRTGRGRPLSPETGVQKPRRCGAPQSGVPLRAVRRGRTLLLHDGARAGRELRRLRARRGRATRRFHDRLDPRTPAAHRRCIRTASPRQASSRHQAIERAGDP